MFYMRTRLCCSCKERKAIKEFTKNVLGKDGFAFRCKSCRRAYVIERNQQRKEMIRVVQKSGCLVCGEKHPACLVFHHRNPKEKLFAISDVGRSIKTIKKEIEKCDVLCANCHRKLHYTERREIARVAKEKKDKKEEKDRRIASGFNGRKFRALFCTPQKPHRDPKCVCDACSRWSWENPTKAKIKKRTKESYGDG